MATDPVELLGAWWEIVGDKPNDPSSTSARSASALSMLVPPRFIMHPLPFSQHAFHKKGHIGILRTQPQVSCRFHRLMGTLFDIFIPTPEHHEILRVVMDFNEQVSATTGSGLDFGATASSMAMRDSGGEQQRNQYLRTAAGLVSVLQQHAELQNPRAIELLAEMRAAGSIRPSKVHVLSGGNVTDVMRAGPYAIENILVGNTQCISESMPLGVCIGEPMTLPPLQAGLWLDFEISLRCDLEFPQILQLVALCQVEK